MNKLCQIFWIIGEPNNAGTYDVSLTATNSSGSDTETKSGYITVSSGGGGVPVVSFNSNASNPYVGQIVKLTDQSTNNPTSGY